MFTQLIIHDKFASLTCICIEGCVLGYTIDPISSGEVLVSVIGASYALMFRSGNVGV